MSTRIFIFNTCQYWPYGKCTLTRFQILLIAWHFRLQIKLRIQRLESDIIDAAHSAAEVFLFGSFFFRLILVSIYTKVSWSNYQMSFHSTRFGYLILCSKWSKAPTFILVSTPFKEQAKTSLLAALIAISLWSSVSKGLIIAVIHLLWSRCQFLIEALNRVLHAVK